MVIVLLLLMNLLYAGVPTFVKLASAQLDPLQVVLMRHGLALLAFFPFYFYYRQAIAIRHLFRIAVTALVAFTFSSVLQTLALHYSSATDGTLILSMEPLLMMLLAYLLLQEKWGAKTIRSVAFALIGFLILSGGNFGLSFGSGDRWIGNGLFLLAVTADALFPIFLKSLLRYYPPPLLAFYCLLFATFYLVPFQTHALVAGMSDWTPVTWSAILYLGIGCSFGACLIWLCLLKKQTVTMIALSWFLQPTLGCFYATFLLREPMTFPTIIGGGFILAALVSLVQIAPARDTVPIATPKAAPNRLLPEHCAISTPFFRKHYKNGVDLAPRNQIESRKLSIFGYRSSNMR